MNLPSRGLRESATTMRKKGAFLAPTRFIRILTAIVLSFRGGAEPRLITARRPHGVRKIVWQSSQSRPAWQALFCNFFAAAGRHQEMQAAGRVYGAILRQFKACAGALRMAESHK